jgi:hypothetical protein
VKYQFLNTSLHFLLGVSSDQAENAAPCTSTEFVDNFHEALFLTMIRMILGRLWKLFPKGKYLRVCKTAHSYLDYYVHLALDSNQAPVKHAQSARQRSLVQGLSTQTDDVGFIRSQLLQGMMASQETTSALLGNVFFLLARHPAIWKQVRDDVLARGDAFPDFDALLEPGVLQNVLLEGQYSRQILQRDLVQIQLTVLSTASIPNLSAHGPSGTVRHRLAGRWRASAGRAHLCA